MKFNLIKYKTSELIGKGYLFIGDGYRAKNKELSNIGIPFARVKNINNGFDFSESDFFPKEDLDKVGNKISQENDCVFTSKGSVGRVEFVDKLVPQFVYSPQLCFWRIYNPNFLDPTYLYFWMNGEEFLHQINYLKGQTDMADYVSLRDQRNMAISLPSIEYQRKIGQALIQFDKKIELNNQINQTLEAMAQALFKSWFVDFEPVKAKIEAKTAGADAEGVTLAAMEAISGQNAEALAKLAQTDPERYAELKATAELFPDALVESELGETPAGWKVSNLGKAMNIFDSKRIPLSKKQRTERKGPYPYYGAASQMDTVDDFLFDGTYVLMAEDGSVMDNRGYPTIQYVWGKFWVNNHAHIMKGKSPISDETLMLFLKNTIVTPYVTGAVQLKINQKNLKSIPFLKANDEIYQSFARMLDPLYEMIKHNIDEANNLSDMRDTLLPKLLSGELSVEDIELSESTQENHS